MVTDDAYRHVPTGTLSILAQRLGRVFAAPSTWHRLVRERGWRRPRLRVHPSEAQVGIRAFRPVALPLFLNTLDSVAKVRVLVASYVDEHDAQLPHSALRGQTPDEVYFGRGAGIPDELERSRRAARAARLKTNRPADRRRVLPAREAGGGTAA